MWRYLHKPWTMIAAVAGVVVLGVAAPDAAAGWTNARQRNAVAVPVGLSTPRWASRVIAAAEKSRAAGVEFNGTSLAAAGVDAGDAGACFSRGPNAGREFSLLTSRSQDRGSAEDAAATYLQCWEDKLGTRRDRSANDMVIEFKVGGEVGPQVGSGPLPPAADDVASAEQPLLIPLPPALWTGLGGFAGLGLAGVMRRSRHWMR